MTPGLLGSPREGYLALRDIIKEDLQKKLKSRFIYPILNSEWFSPMVIVPKNNGKW